MNLRLLVLALGTFAIGTDGFMIAGILSTIAADLGIRQELAGLMVTAFALAYAVASPVLAALTGRWARKKVLVLSLLIFTLANVWAALSGSYGTLLGARLLAALGAALYTPAATATAAGLVPANRRGMALAVVLGGLTAATALGVPFGTWIGNGWDWRLTFGLVAVLGLIAVLGVALLLPAVPNPPALTLRARLAPLRQGRVLLALSVTVLWTIGGFSVYTYITPLLEKLAPLSPSGLTAMVLVYGIAGVFGNMLGGYAADRMKSSVRALQMNLVLLSATLIGFSLLVQASWSGAVVPAILLAVWGVLGWALQAPQQHRLIGMMPNAPTVVLSLNGAVLYVGIALGALIGGIVLLYASVDALGWIGGGFELLALGVLWLSSSSLVGRPHTVEGISVER
jgi:DHA1 family inner membrane transport protein